MNQEGGRGRSSGASLESERVRRLIERGLERYGRGQLEEAVAEWEHALMLDERNAEAKELIAFVRDKIIARGLGDSEFSEKPRTDGIGRTGWGLAGDPPPRPDLSRDTPQPMPALPEAPNLGTPVPTPIPGRTLFAWGGHGRAESVGSSGEPMSDPTLANARLAPHEGNEDLTTDPGAEAIRSTLDELDFSNVHPGDNKTPGFIEAATDPAASLGGGRSRRQTLRSAIPAMLAASMPEPSGPTQSSSWPEPASPQPIAAGDDETTRQIGVAPMEPASGPATPISSSELHIVDLGEDLSATARKRASEMVDRARAAFEGGNMEAAAEAAEFALSEGERAPPPGIAEVIEPARPLFHRIFEAHVGPGQGSPSVNLTAHEISAMTFDHRTGFLLSRIDGTLTIDELMDVSGMGGFDTFRILSSLLRSGIVGVR